MASVKRPMMFGVGVAAVALVSAGLAVWSILKVAGEERAQTRIEQRVIHDERPTQRQLLQAIVHALAVCHADRSCARALQLARQGRAPNGQPVAPQTGSGGSAPVGGAPTSPGSQPAPRSPPSSGPTGGGQPPAGNASPPPSPSQPSPPAQPQPQPQPPVALPGPLKPVGPILCGLTPQLCR